MEYLIAFIVIIIFAGIFYFWAKKENITLEEMLSNLTEEQKNELKDNQVENFDEKNIHGLNLE